jgi:hypothetical protein
MEIATIEVKSGKGNPPVVIGGERITHFDVRPTSFAEFVRLAEQTNQIAGDDPKKWKIINRRIRMRAQIKTFAGTKQVEMTDLDIAQLPVQYGVALSKACDEGDGKAGDIVNPNDSISSPALYRLGTPLRFQQNSDEGMVTELEFIAKTFGDVEEIVSEQGQPQQMLVALNRICKPVGMPTVSMPTWAVEQITLADGFKMIETILPRFFA